ncbi:adenylate/guanylate cyclase domain-containing protein [candidate division TA06 bacterium]|nr:adenylate/guanylate cyclase domain-containing protein [candidate division TA06 bacterium]
MAHYRYNSLEDYLISQPLTVDGVLDDGWGASFPVKGREVEATILFSDISSFTRRTLDLTPTETLIFVNNFFSWITAEALRDKPAIIDKYVGDEMMIVFSNEFGSKDHFVDAIQTARWMGEYDILDFRPHIGIASGPVIIGYVGTPVKYNCSVFGHTVALAKRCAGVKMSDTSPYMVFPTRSWQGRSFEEIIPLVKMKKSESEFVELPQSWKLAPSRKVSLNNIGDVDVMGIINMLLTEPSQSAVERAKESLTILKANGSCRQ